MIALLSCDLSLMRRSMVVPSSGTPRADHFEGVRVQACLTCTSAQREAGAGVAAANDAAVASKMKERPIMLTTGGRTDGRTRIA